MTFFTSLIGKDFRKTLVVVFTLTSLIPLLLLIYFLFKYTLPYLAPFQIRTAVLIFAFCLTVMFLISLLGFFLMLQSMSTLVYLSRIFNLKSKQIYPEDNNINSFGINIFDFLKTAIGFRGKSQFSANAITTFMDVALTLTSELDFDRLFPLIISKITDAMSAERTSFYVVDWEKGELWTTVSENIDQIR